MLQITRNSRKIKLYATDETLTFNQACAKLKQSSLAWLNAECLTLSLRESEG